MAKTPASQVSSPRTRSREHANSGQKSADTGQQKRSLRAKPSGSQEPRSPKSPRSGSKPSKQQQASKELQETPPSVEPRSSNTDSPLDPSIKEEADNASATKSSANKSGGQRKRQRKAPSAAEAQREAENAQKEAEDEILAKAKAIRRIRYQKSWQASAEPKREKEHWDFLIDEMQWMAKEFARERKWKTAQAKRLVRKTAASEKNLELRESARQREEKQQLKRKALFLGKEVAKFWAKAERLVVYKAKSIAEAKKKEIMDKHLSFLVGQTQRYSSMLAKRLHQDGDEEEFKPEQKPEAEEQAVTQSASPAEPDKSKGARGVEEAQVGEDRDAWGTSIGDGDMDDGEEFEAGSDSGADDEATLEEEMDLAKDEEDETAIEVQDLQDEADMPIEQLLARYGRGPSSSAPITEPPAVQTPPEPAEESDQPPAEPPAGEGAGDEEYEEEEGGEDIEDTLDQEDRLAAQDGTDAKLEQSAELAALNAEAEMPLEELMAMYRNARSEHDDSSDEDIEIPAGPQQDTSWAQDLVLPDSSQPVGFLAKDKPIESKPAGPVQQPNALEELPIATTTDKPSPSVTQETPVEGDEEYEEEEGGEDIEDTLDQEDRLAAQDGTDAKAEQSAELAALNAEAEMPLEELMAMYRNRPSPEHSDSSDEDTMSVDLPSGLPRDTSWAQDLVLPGPSQPAEDQKPLLPGSVEKDESRKEDLSPEADELIPDHQTLTSGVSDPEKDDSKVEEQEPEDTETEDAERKGGSKEELVDAAQLAAEAQPTGYTFETTSVSTKAPFLLKHTMREYQHIGLDWLVTIYTRRLNGILADEMGLGKTIQTIALLAYLACEKGIWGPHLIVVPTSVMLNWEMECKKWCPAFKLMTYYGSAKERKLKRQGWSKPNAFHICITSYTIVLQDAKMFRRKKWKYLILDEAHMIKNWKSQRWQTLLNFNSARRLLITGTPLQNDLMELWSLMHFLMPQVFASHAQFKDWFSNPLTGMVEGSEGINKALVERLHSVLRPFLLRRLKSEVEKQMPGKHEHVIKCRLSKRQRTLYEDYMASSDTRNTLSSGNYLGIMNVLMSLRKVCNHPDLFEGRSIVSAFDCPRVEVQVPSVALTACAKDVWRDVNPGQLGFEIANDTSTPLWAAQRIQELTPELHEYEQLPMPPPDPLTGGLPFVRRSLQSTLPFQASAKSLQIVASVKAQLQMSRMEEAGRRAAFNATLSHARSTRLPHCGPDMVERLTIRRDANKVRLLSSQPSRYFEYTNCLRDMVVLPEERADAMEEEIETFVFAIPKARANSPQIWCSHPDQSEEAVRETEAEQLRLECQSKNQLLHKSDIRQKLFFPDRRLVQFDCGKLQELAVLLHQLKAGGHKALIFTQMTKMLDILEVFLNLNNHAYVRLDGSTKPEQRQILMQRFNTNPKLFVFILSTRSGGVGMNLTGADTVIFYDSDWNPAMDAQAQDRCHRIGQTREVHIYRLVSEKTIEENILIKSEQKRHLDHLAIQSGGFNTDFLQKFNPQDLLSLQGGQTNDAEIRAAMRNAEDENDAAAANLAEEETAAELAEFTAEPPAPLPDPDDANSNAAGTGNKEEGLSDEMKQAKVEADETKALADELGVETGNQDSLTALEQALKPIERYAVKWVEQVRMSEGLYDVDANAAVAQQQVDTQEWNMQEIERQKRIQEEEAEEEGEVERMAEWDKKAADEAYRIEVERAQQQQKLLEEQLLAEQLALEKAQAEALEAAQEAAAAELSRQNKRKRSEDLQEEALSPHKDWQPSTSRRGRQIQRPSRHGDVEISSDDDDDIYYRSHKQARTTARQRAVMEQKQHRSSHEIANGHKNTQSQRLVKVWVPWEPSEDLVLCAVVAWSLSNPSTPQDTTAASQPAAGSNQGDLTPQSQQSGQHTNSINGRPGDPQTTNGGLEDSKPQEDTVADKETMILPAIWQSASNALTCGSSALTPTAANTAFQARSRRSPMACKARYNMLLKAHKAAISNSGSSGPQSGILSKLLVVLKVHTELSAQELLEMMTKARQVHESTGNTVALSPSTMKLLEKFQNLQASVPPPGSDGLEPEALFTVVSLERANAVLAAVSKACSPTAEAIQANLRRVLGSLSGSTLKEVHLAHLARLQPAPPPSLPPPAAPTQPAAAPQYSALPGAAAAAYPIFRPSPPSSGNAASLPKANFQRGHGLESSQGHGTFSSRIGPTEMMRPAVITAPSLNAKGAPQQNKTAKPGQRRGSERISVTMQPQMLAGWSQHPTMGSFPAASPVAYPSATGAYPAGSTVAYPSAPAGGYPAGSAGVYPVGNQGAYPPAFQLYPRLPVTSMAGSLPSSLPFSQIQPFFSGALMPPPRLPGFWQQFPIPGFPSTTAASPQPQPGQNQGSAALSVPASGVQSTQLLPGNAAASMPDWLQQRLQQVPTPMPFPTSLAQPPPSQTAGNLPSQAAGNQSSTQTGPSQPQSQNPIS